MQALRAGLEWDEASRDAWWRAYYGWLEPRLLLAPGRWAIVPDSPGAPSQINDALLNDWPFGRSRGAPVWHMNQPIERLGRLCERYDRVCLGWIGHPKEEPVGCDDYLRRMEDVATFYGNRWHPTHMLRGVLVANLFPFVSADSSSLAQNGHRYDWRDDRETVEFDVGADGVWRMRNSPPAPWKGRRFYADRLEAGHFRRRIHRYEPLPQLELLM
jgi:hypothetical protein